MRRRITSAIATSAVVASLLAGCAAAPQAAAPAASEETTSQEEVAEAADGDVQYVLYLGTNDQDTNQPMFEHEEAKRLLKEILIKHVSGYTISEAEGGWTDDEGTLFEEYTLVIYLSDTTLDQVHALCDELLASFDQSSVLIQTNKTTTEFYSG